LAWTTPRTYTTGEVITKTILDTHVRDNFNMTAPAILTTAGDILYASSANTPARLAKDTNATRYLANTGTSNVPAWGQVNLANGVTGTLPVGNGGTGATTLTDGGILIGNGSGAFVAMAVLADGEMVVGDGTTDPVAESGATLRTSIGVGTGNSPQFTGIELSHATANTLTASSGVLSIEGNAVYMAGGTDVAVADGGTNLSSYAAGDVIYASGTTTLAKLNKPGSPAGEVLTFASGASAPSWVAASAGVGLGLVIAVS
jgi:hypothetical protein